MFSFFTKLFRRNNPNLLSDSAPGDGSDTDGESWQTFLSIDSVSDNAASETADPNRFNAIDMPDSVRHEEYNRDGDSTNFDSGTSSDSSSGNSDF